MTWLDEIEQRAEAAHPGPWIVDCDSRDDGADQIVRPDGSRYLTVAFMATPIENHEADAAFLSAARTDIPRLVTTLRAIERLAERMDGYSVVWATLLRRILAGEAGA